MFLQEPEEKRLIFPANYTIIFSVIRRRGETGRRNRLKICRGRPRIGSIPIDGTTQKGDLFRSPFCVVSVRSEWKIPSIAREEAAQRGAGKSRTFSRRRSSRPKGEIDGTKTPQEPSLLRGFDVHKIGMEKSFDCVRGGGAARSGKGGVVFGAVRTAAAFHLSPFPAACPKGRRREAHSHISARRCGRAAL